VTRRHVATPGSEPCPTFVRPWPILLAGACAATPHAVPRDPDDCDGSLLAATRSDDVAVHAGSLAACDGTTFERVPVTTHAVDVVLAPGAAPLGASLEAGFRLPATDAAWLPVHVTGPIAIDGWVPASARGWAWHPTRQRTMDRGTMLRFSHAPVRRGRSDDGPVVAVLDGWVHVDVTDAADAGAWVFVVAHLSNRVRAAGYVRMPARDVDPHAFDGDVIEGELVNPEGIKD
jgi:hypothetical protein